MNPGVLAGVSLWRALVVAFSLIGFGAAVAGFSDPWQGLSQQASLLNAVVYLGLLVYPLFTRGRRHEPRSPWLRDAMSVLLLRNQANPRWWHPLSWIAFPLAYLVYVAAAGVPLYHGFLDLIALIAVGYVLYALGRVRAAIIAGHPEPAGAMP